MTWKTPHSGWRFIVCAAGALILPLAVGCSYENEHHHYHGRRDVGRPPAHHDGGHHDGRHGGHHDKHDRHD